ncbi:PAS domain-containing sensor histidine kinase [Desulfonatronovibrio magnus]|uniref:PAS domain-containing sensor histidine kinase n=1 Tax=Desulfonatronovibrio magnus TaxID=698827 RepID=UPI000695EC19|nr:PAS domain S-box protein [Desulfonatronovibrio magnus]RQD65367.1 MAG: PAS domain-containing sensor histidine kinase [Desulfonatronovibrio sp. MSAO_Bac4]
MPSYFKKNVHCDSANFPDIHDILLDAPIGVFISTPEGKYLTANPALARMYGYDSPGEMIKSITDIAAQVYACSKDRESFINLLEAQGQVANHECRMHRRDGTWIWVSMNARAVRDQGGNIVAYQGFVSDITDRKKAESVTQERLKELNCLYGISKLIEQEENADKILQGVVNLMPNGWQHSEVAGARVIVEEKEYLTANFRETDWRQSADLQVHGKIVGMIEVCYFEERPIMDEGPFLKEERQLLNAIAERLGKIIERKQADLVLSNSQKMMVRAEELTESGSWKWDIINDTWLLSDNCKRIHGITDNKLTTPQLLLIAYPEDRPAIEKAFVQAIEDDKPCDIEYRIVRQDTGDIRHVHARGLIETDDKGKPAAMFGAVQDITVFKQAHKLIIESEARFRSLFENSPISYQSLNEEGRYIDVNDRICQLLGYERFEILGKNFGELWSQQTRHKYPETFEEFKYRGCVKGDIELLHKNGQSIFVLLEGRTQRDTEGKFIRTHCILYDITERKKAEHKIKSINEQLQKVNAEKDKLFTIIAHDLKSPMAGVYGTSQILAEEPDSLSLEEISHISAEIQKISKKALDLLNDLMQWARMSQGGMDFSPEKCSLYELARSSLYTACDVAEKKNITVKCLIPEDIIVMADQPMINTVIRNVIFNAVKFTNCGGNISITASQPGPDVQVCISDNGIGMSEAILSNAFSINKCKRRVGTDGEKGTGLGLVLCKEFVEKHGGRIWLESEPGKGTKVYFTLPGKSGER